MAKANGTSAAHVQAVERRAKALTLRKAGHSYLTIAAQLGVDRSVACRYVHAALAELTASEPEDAAALRTLELARLDTQLTAIWPAVLNGHLGAQATALRIAERRAALLGLDAPRKVAPTDPTGEHVYAPPPDATIAAALDRITAWEAAHAAGD